MSHRWVSLAGLVIVCSFACTVQASPSFTAMLVDPEAKAAKGNATVEVRVQEIELIDPATADDKPRVGQGHVHYRVDAGPVIATPAAKLSFHELKPGRHEIEVGLVGNDHLPLMPPKLLEVTVPNPSASADPSAPRH